MNVEYQSKIIELTELANDVDNLLTNSQVGKLLLDENLHIRRFSTFTKNIFKILEVDIGRPLSHITHGLVGVDPVKEVREVIETRKAVEKEVKTVDGRWYFMSVLPYHIGHDTYAGALLSFMDISQKKSLETELQGREAGYRLLFDGVSNGVAVFRAVDGGEDFEFVDFNPSAEKIEHIKREDLIGKRLRDAFPGVEEFGLLDILRHVWKTGESKTHPASLYRDDRITGLRENQIFKLPTGEVVAIYKDFDNEK